MGVEFDTSQLASGAEYLTDEHQSYEGCTPLQIGLPDGQSVLLYAPPWETAQFYPKDVIFETLRIQMSLFPEARFDRKGQLFTRDKEVTPGGKVRYVKRICGNAATVDQVLERLRAGGYDIPNNFFTQEDNNERIRHMHLYPNGSPGDIN